MHWEFLNVELGNMQRHMWRMMIHVYIWWFILINKKLVIIGKNYGFLSKPSINQQPFNEILYIHTPKKKKIMAYVTDVSSVYGVSLRFGIGIK